MSTRESLARYSLIIKKLERYPATFKEIANYLAAESELQAYDFNISKRTFQRDRDDIRSLYRIDIAYDFSKKVYYIDQGGQPEIRERMWEVFDMFNALNQTDKLTKHIHLEKRKPQGTEHLYGLLHAVKNSVQLKFIYRKYWMDEETERHVEPYALKEFKNRLYLLSRDLKDEKVKIFALDRMMELEILKKRFSFPEDFDVHNYYRHCFGIMAPNAEQPKEVVLSFEPFQGKYIKSLPLHESQEILIDNTNELRVKLTLFITHDFVMEILSYGNNVHVLQPQDLIKSLTDTFKSLLEKYETNADL